MIRPLLIAKIAVFAAVLNAAALVFPLNTWAAVRPVSDSVAQSLLAVGQEITFATWHYSDRSFVTFGHLVSGEWDNSSWLSYLWSIKKLPAGKQNIQPVAETKKVEPVSNLSGKIEETQAIANELFINTQYLTSTVGLLELKWGKADDQDVVNLVENLSQKLGNQDDSSSSDSVFGLIAHLNQSWDWESVKEIQNRVIPISGVLNSLNDEVKASGQSPVAFKQVELLVSQLAELNSLIGEATDQPTGSTLFGQFGKTKLLTDSLEYQSQDLKQLLAGWNSYNQMDNQTKLADLVKEVNKINRVPHVESLLFASPITEQDLKNYGYGIQAVISANKELLAGKAGSPLSTNWLQLGSIDFKTLLSNPSTSVNQNISVGYFLPPEVRKEDILEIDPGLSVAFNSEKRQFFVSGQFTLAPTETRTATVRVKDVWVINQAEISQLRDQAKKLSNPLAKLSFIPYFAQGLKTRNDIDISLNNVQNLINFAPDTPEDKIQTYHQAQSELSTVRSGIGKLKEISNIASILESPILAGALMLAVLGGVVLLTLRIYLIFRSHLARGETVRRAIWRSILWRFVRSRSFINRTAQRRQIQVAGAFSQLN